MSTTEGEVAAGVTDAEDTVNAVSELVNQLTKPLYVYRMARCVDTLSGRTRKRNASNQIQEIVLEWARTRNSYDDSDGNSDSD